jgi:hypothetical protein
MYEIRLPNVPVITTDKECHAQTGDVAAAPTGTLQSVALNGLSGSFGNIGRLKNNYHYWTTEYIYTYGRPTGLAAAFLRYLSNAVGLNDLASAGYTPCQDADHPSARQLCARRRVPSAGELARKGKG